MNKLYIVLIITLSLFACNMLNNKLIIEGELSGLQAGDTLFFSYRNAMFETKTDTCIAKKGYFHFEKEWDEPTIYTLKSKKSAASLVIVAEKRTPIHISGALLNLAKTSIYTYKQQKVQQEWDLISAGMQEKIVEMQVKVDAAGLNGDIMEQKKCFEEYEDVLKKQKKQIIEFALLHPNSIVSASLVARYLDKEEDIKSLEKLYSSFSYGIQDGKYGKKINQIIVSLKQTQIGEKAPNFNLTDSSQNKVKLSDFRGKYVLLDFWASWCVPCRKESPLLVDIYQKYHEKGLEIIGISLDKNKKEWINAIQNDQANWVQLTDFKAVESETVKLYGIKEIPQNFLLGKKGEILAKNLHQQALIQKLATLLP